MTMDAELKKEDHRGRRVVQQGAANAPVYGLGFLGALVYYIQHADTIWAGLLGLLKAIFWPGMLVYELLKYLEM
jgi:hypothetical protein